MAARLRAPRLLLTLALLTAAATLAIAPAEGAQEPDDPDSTVCHAKDVDTDVYSDGAWEIRVASAGDPEGTIYDLTAIRSLPLPRGRWLWVSMADPIEGRRFMGWKGSAWTPTGGVLFDTPNNAGTWVWIEGTWDNLNGGCDAWISADYSDPA